MLILEDPPLMATQSSPVYMYHNFTWLISFICHNLFFIFKKERWTWNKFTTFNGGVQNVNLGGGRDVNSIGIRAVLRWIYMNIRDGYAIAGIYWDMTFWAVNNSYPLHLKIITVVKGYSLQLHMRNKRILVSETLVHLINTDNIHVSFLQGRGCIS